MTPIEQNTIKTLSSWMLSFQNSSPTQIFERFTEWKTRTLPLRDMFQVSRARRITNITLAFKRRFRRVFYNNCNPEITCFLIIYRCWVQCTSCRYRLLPISIVNKLVKVNASRFSILLWENNIVIIAKWSNKSSLF